MSSTKRTDVPTLSGVSHRKAVSAFQKAGFRILRDGRHIVMTDETHKLTIPRHNPVNAITMGGIVRDAGLTIEQFKNML